MPMGSSEERHWLCEGLVTYLSAPCIPYAADPAVVDSLASDAAAAKLSAPLREIHDEIAAIFQEMTGRDISQARQMDLPPSGISGHPGLSLRRRIRGGAHGDRPEVPGE